MNFRWIYHWIFSIFLYKCLLVLPIDNRLPATIPFNHRWKQLSSISHNKRSGSLGLLGNPPKELVWKVPHRLSVCRRCVSAQTCTGCVLFCVLICMQLGLCNIRHCLIYGSGVAIVGRDPLHLSPFLNGISTAPTPLAVSHFNDRRNDCMRACLCTFFSRSDRDEARVPWLLFLQTKQHQ